MNIIFDLDGTLVESTDAICRSVNYALKKRGFNIVGHDVLKLYIGRHLLELFRELTGVDDRAYLWEMINLYRERFETIGIKENKLYPGISDMLGNLYTKNYIASIKPHHASRMILSELQMDKYFIGVYGAEVDGTRADKTELLHYLKNKEKISNAIMVGDRDTDIFAAQSCGFKAIGVTYGYGTEKELEKAKPDYIVNTPVTLFERLELLCRNSEA